MLSYQDGIKLEQEICESQEACGNGCALYNIDTGDCVIEHGSRNPEEAERRLIAYRDSKRLKLSEAGLKLLKLLPEEYKDWWIARDKDGAIWVYAEVPIRDDDDWVDSMQEPYHEMTVYSNHFPITWEDEPKKISEWIKESE